MINEIVVTTIIGLSTIICVALFVLPTLQKQKYEHIEKMQKRDYELAEAQLKLEQEKVRYGKYEK